MPRRPSRETRRARRRRAHQAKQIIAVVILFVLIVTALYFLLPSAEEEDALSDLPSATETPTPEPEEVLPTEIYTIVIDSGHSYANGGAVGINYLGETILEENITAETSQYLYELLDNDPNFQVYLTHAYDEDMGIVERREYAATLDPDFLISIHANGNAQSDDIRGFEVYAQVPEHPYHEESLEIAQYIIDGFTEAGHTPRKGTGLFYMRYVLNSSGSYDTYVLTPEEEETYNFTGEETLGVIEHEDFPALLVEQGYVTSITDVKNWLAGDGCEAAAQIYYDAICQYFGVAEQ